MSAMRIVNEAELGRVLSRLPAVPRVTASGNYAAPLRVLRLLDEVVPEYRLHMLNAQPGIPDRDGVTYETAFVGPAMRGHPRLTYFPCRLSLLPHLLRQRLQPDIVLLHTSTPAEGALSLGVEVNILPAAIEAARARGGLVIAQANAAMPKTYGDAVVGVDVVDYLLEVDDPLPAHSPGPVDPVSAAIGDQVAALIPP